jgi:hypothetical protein
LVEKRAIWHQRWIHRALVVLTAGQMRAYLDSFQTTLGQTVYVTDDWNERSVDSRYVTLRHELVHIRPFRRLSFPLMALLYVLLPLPLGLAYGRARLEWEAYSESIRAGAEVYGQSHVTQGIFRDHIVEQFVGPSYGWMWPFRKIVERWYDQVLAELQ